ncbi:hypothetical protein KC19_VG137400 [Ceratodon purpureus]|uniref:Uncharacterized protein n=1 Tax=Ceratodon purpureus TaxID=3225 RepID=A0A8T0HPX5_CERPU|nr:hypothetical protein KC19_VG137400 [Ceratodon purpureus]
MFSKPPWLEEEELEKKEYMEKSRRVRREHAEALRKRKCSIVCEGSSKGEQKSVGDGVQATVGTVGEDTDKGAGHVTHTEKKTPRESTSVRQEDPKSKRSKLSLPVRPGKFLPDE